MLSRLEKTRKGCVKNFKSTVKSKTKDYRLSDLHRAAPTRLLKTFPNLSSTAHQTWPINPLGANGFGQTWCGARAVYRDRYRIQEGHGRAKFAAHFFN